MESDTPRTDRFIESNCVLSSYADYFSMLAEWARGLERECASYEVREQCAAPEAATTERDARLWRDLVLLHPMDLVVIYSGAGSDKVLLTQLQEWIERKRPPQPGVRPKEET